MKNHWHWAILALLTIISGCATPPPSAETDATIAAKAARVRFFREPPPNAKFIAKIPYSSGSTENWRSECANYLSREAAKLGGNVVVPGVELDYGGRRIETGDPRFNSVHPPVFVQTENIHGQLTIIPGHFHFWSKVYFCPE